MKEPKPNTTQKTLASLSSGKRSGWKAASDYRAANKGWLRRSQKIALLILDALDAKGITQKAFAEDYLNVTPQYVSKIVKGQENLSLETIFKIETLLGITLMDVREPAVVTTARAARNHTVHQSKKYGVTIPLGQTTSRAYGHALKRPYEHSLGNVG